jgi:hypothetical protein
MKYTLSRYLFILAVAQEVELKVEWFNHNSLNVSCQAKRIYPEPVINLFIEGLESQSARYA